MSNTLPLSSVDKFRITHCDALTDNKFSYRPTLKQAVDVAELWARHYHRQDLVLISLIEQKFEGQEEWCEVGRVFAQPVGGELFVSFVNAPQEDNQNKRSLYEKLVAIEAAIREHDSLERECRELYLGGPLKKHVGINQG